MKILRVIKNYAAIIGIRPLGPSETTPFNLRNVAVSSLMGLFTILSTIYLAFDVNTIQQRVDIFFVWFTTLVTSIGLLSAVQKSEDIFLLAEHVERLIATQSTDLVTKRIYANVGGMISKWTRIVHTLLIKISIPFGVIPLATFSYYLYYTTEMGSDAFYLPLSTKLPFNWRTPDGYAVTLLVLAVLFALLCHTAFCAFGLEIGFFGMAMTIGQNLNRKFHKLNENYTIDGNDSILKNELRDAIHFHLEAKELVVGYTTISENHVTLYYVWSTLSICDSLLMFHIAQNWADLFQPIALIFWSFALIFMICEFGERLNQRFNEINKEVFFWDWYTFPVDIQKVLPLILIGTQNQVGLSGFGNITCTRDAFKDVSYTGFSYFTILRTV